MKRSWTFAAAGVVLVASGAYAEHRMFEANAPRTIGVTDPGKVVLKPSPIRREWVLEGRPDTRAAEIAQTNDGATHVYVWSTTKSRFNWFYDFDEVITVVDGEVFIADEGKPERRLGPGDVAFFPTGARTTWRVPDHVRKIATIKKPLPGPVASLMRWARVAKGWVKPADAFAEGQNGF